MKAIGKILAIADPAKGSDAGEQRAVARGFALAQQLKAELRILLVCDYIEYLESRGSLHPARAKRARYEYGARKRAWLQELASSFGAPAFPVTLEVVCDRPLHEGIGRQVLRYQPDLVIKDTHHHPAIARALFTNTDWHLIRECPSPLMLVRTGSWPATGRILAAVDPLQKSDKPGSLDLKLLDAASYFARAINGELHVLHVFEPMEAMLPVQDRFHPLVLPPEEVNAKLLSQHAKALDSLVEGLALPAGRVQLRCGGVRDVLIEATHALNAALIVMGAVARSGLRQFIGSTAEQALEQLPCDVLVVKPDGFEPPLELYEQAPLLEDIVAAGGEREVEGAPGEGRSRQAEGGARTCEARWE
jgi:universal stress protein E